jgi:hypothetical protein
VSHGEPAKGEKFRILKNMIEEAAGAEWEM